MSNLFFISDLHFGHHNILQMSPSRKILGDTLEEQHVSLIDRWNSVVRKKDTVWVLGDVAVSAWAYRACIPQLNGYKKLVRGNHDTLQESEYRRDFGKIFGAIGMELFPGCSVVLTHIPIHTQEMEFRWRFNIHGHIHEKHVMIGIKDTEGQECDEVPDYRYINVSCEQTNFYPLALEELRLIAQRRLGLL